MHIKLLDILRCPTCENTLACHCNISIDNTVIVEGSLECNHCNRFYPIINSIPRFVPMDNYAASFGYQWNLFKYTQVDKFSKITHSEKRFFDETQWTKDSIKNNWILDAGCGNGRFVEICSRNDCQVVGVDISSAIDAAGELFRDRSNVHLIQASIYELPFAKNSFDKIYSIGVIQHTPDPQKSVKSLPKLLKDNGQLVLTIYERKPWTLLYSKYFLRPITKRLNKKTLLNGIKLLSPVLFPLTEVLFRIPFFGKIFKFIIPYSNYVNMKELSIKQRYEWAILDTFDMLSPAYDKPMTENEVRQCLEQVQVRNIKRLPNPGLNVVAYK